jgi:hypothetical protein
MPRHVYKTESHAVFFQKRKAQINRNPAPLLFREPVGMRARQRLHKRRLAMINMPCGPDDYAFQVRSPCRQGKSVAVLCTSTS